MSVVSARQPFIERALRAQSWSRSRAQGAQQRGNRDVQVDSSSSSDDDGGSRSVGIVPRVTVTDSVRRAIRRREGGSAAAPVTPARSSRRPYPDTPADAATPAAAAGGAGGLSQLSALQAQLEELRTQYPHISAAIRKRQQPPPQPPSQPPVQQRDAAAPEVRWRGVDGSRVGALRGSTGGGAGREGEPPLVARIDAPRSRVAEAAAAAAAAPPRASAYNVVPEPRVRFVAPRVRDSSEEPPTRLSSGSTGALRASDADAAARAQSAAAPLVTSLALELQVGAALPSPRRRLLPRSLPLPLPHPPTCSASTTRSASSRASCTASGQARSEPRGTSAPRSGASSAGPLRQRQRRRRTPLLEGAPGVGTAVRRVAPGRRCPR